MVLRNEYIRKISAYIDAPFVKILSGIRRSGKSTILKMIADKLLKNGVLAEQILFYNFDSLQNENIKTAALLYAEIKSKLSNNGKTYLFFDEIQEVTDWERAVNSFMIDFDIDIYVTGSNSRMLSSEISTYLTGRYVRFNVYPLSFSEYLDFRSDAKADIYTEFSRYIRFGGFPAIHLKDYTPDEAYTIVRDIYSSAVMSDIVKHSQVRKLDQFERIVRFAFDNIGRTFSAGTIAKYLKSENRSIDNETVYNYLSKLQSAFILHRCSRYDLRGKEILKTQEKLYLADPALRYAVLGYSSDSIAAMLENIVFLELMRRGYEINIGLLKDGAEIDFVAQKQEKRLYIQITERIESPDTEKREYSRLLEIKDNYPKYVLRTDAFAGGNYAGIKTMHIADFLLSEEF
jgi:predicted AAA+ superfamily ATPase